MKNTMVTISCGMGNQLFQYAFGYAMSKRRESKLMFYRINGGDHRPYVLNLYGIVPDKEIIEGKITLYDRVILKFYRRISEKSAFEYDESYYDLKNKNIFYNGYWQSFKYFEEYCNDIKEILVYQGEKSKKFKAYMNNLKDNTISVHVRRGDYINDKDNLSIGMEYYKEAYNRISGLVMDNAEYLIFSDDKEYVKEALRFIKNARVVEGISDIEEFELMRACSHHIIANSTFSWWSAYLSQNKGGMIFAPCVYNWKEEFYPTDWNILKASI